MSGAELIAEARRRAEELEQLGFSNAAEALSALADEYEAARDACAWLLRENGAGDHGPNDYDRWIDARIKQARERRAAIKPAGGEK